jgi:hypothetical protein
MIIGDVLGVTFIALAACVSLWALLIGTALVFGERAAEAQTRLETRPFPMLGIGVGLALTAGLIGQILVSQPNRMLKLVGWALLLGLLTMSVLGGAGLALIVAGRIQQAAPRLTLFAALGRGAGLMIAGGLVPVIGWFVVLPLGVLTTLGAGMGAMFGRPSAVAKRLPVIVATNTPDALP